MRDILRLGFDVGGTNTDAVLMLGREVLHTAKSFTTADVRSGVVDVASRILRDWGGPRERIEAVMIGTTQFVNAFVQRRGLAPVAVIRVSLPKADGVPPMAGWPDDVVEALGSSVHMVGGGSFYTGEEYAPLDVYAVRAAAREAAARGLRSFAISANFAPMRPDIEERAAAIVREEVPDATITLSAQLGGLGLIDRENATIVNASLADLGRKVVQSLIEAFAELDIHVPIFISQNDGTLITTDEAQRFPILTCSAGPTNSIRGAAFLTGLSEAIVADIGGTTTDIGFLRKGFPRETTAANYIGGVRTNFRMPDVLSIGLGGGSLVRQRADGAIRVGPDSVGFRLQQEGLVFGGDTLTTTDIAVRSQGIALGDSGRVAHLDDAFTEAALDAIHQAVTDGIDQVKTSSQPMPLILVGGGNILISRDIKGASQVLRPKHAEVANAIGAAIALVSGRVDRLYDLSSGGREGALATAKQEALAAAVQAGADPDAVEVVDVTELPLTHMKAGSVQIRVRAAGPLATLR
ncbi:hydantoinase/oxoprolinase family protein [Flavisphingomonas formosensis]|uniref:hydantoinase/oxoprolinase family protein n=1 Tax=Flavisphingomonas formosensis TaxID=861534 RepID=UPI0012FBDC35|nr:hydantoinase/oxoprolinase family protein [Sphingomonas formosensis]